LGKELIVGAESMEAVRREIDKVLQRAAEIDPPSNPHPSNPGYHEPTEFQERLEQLRKASGQRPSYLKEPTMTLPTGEKCEVISPEYYHLLSWFNIPLPDYSFSIEPEAQERKIDAVLKQLQQGVERIQQSDVFRQFLITMSKFHQYSFGNQILIMLQSPHATRVAGFNTWKDLGRYVKRGESGIAILAPCLPARMLACPVCGKGFTERDLRSHIPQAHPEEVSNVADLVRRAKEGAEMADAPTFFKVVYVFDVSQTEGKPLPEVEVPALTGEANEELFSKLMDLAKSQGLTVSFESRPDLPVEIKGEYRQPPTVRELKVKADIWVRPEEGRAQQLKTLAHEMAHYFTESVFGIPRADAETIAESVAFVVSAHWGFDTGSRSFSYVALWAKDKKVLERNLKYIREVSERIIKALSTQPSRLVESKTGIFGLPADAKWQFYYTPESLKRLDPQFEKVRGDWEVEYKAVLRSPPTPSVKQFPMKYGDYVSVDTSIVDFRPEEDRTKQNVFGGIITLKDHRYKMHKDSELMSEERNPACLWRGMSAEEWLTAIKAGAIRSAGEYNIGQREMGYTYFSEEARQALHYASGFAPWQFMPTWKLPAVVVQVKRPSDGRLDTSRPPEVGIKGEIPLSDIAAVYEIRVAVERPGYIEYTYHPGGQLTEGSRSTQDQNYVIRQVPPSEWGTFIRA
jgi:hypothetical protein